MLPPVPAQKISHSRMSRIEIHNARIRRGVHTGFEHVPACRPIVDDRVVDGFDWFRSDLGSGNVGNDSHGLREDIPLTQRNRRSHVRHGLLYQENEG